MPKDEQASLVFLTTTDVRRINPYNGKLLDQLNATDISAIEIWHRNRTLCAMYSSRWEAVDMKCYRIDNFNVTWSMPLPELITSIHCKYVYVLDKEKTGTTQHSSSFIFRATMLSLLGFICSVIVCCNFKLFNEKLKKNQKKKEERRKSCKSKSLSIMMRLFVMLHL